MDDQNASLKSQILKYEQELVKVKKDYGVIFDLLNKTRDEASNELDHYLAHTKEVLNFAGSIRSENQDLIHHNNVRTVYLGDMVIREVLEDGRNPSSS